MSQAFGGVWTVQKLDCVREYLAAYVNVMRHQHQFTTYYVDAFAGTGYVELRSFFGQDAELVSDLTELEQESRFLLQGSAAQALEISPPFDRYVFIESSEWRVQQLDNLRRCNSHLLGSIDIRHGDANQQLRALCGQWNRRSDRGVVFLDPFGMEVEWSTLEAIARTGSLDLWYLVPISTVNRLLPRESEVRIPGWRQRLRLFFGTDTWETSLYQRSRESTLFGEEEYSERVGDWRAVADFLIGRLRTLFPAVAENPRLLTNSHGTPLFLLCFAVSNPSEKASGIALRIARHILGSH